ncbi:MAG TPA: VOC family protein [Terriglobales bacterium]|nr:VOC family protein [Terriglobales bacterium]
MELVTTKTKSTIMPTLRYHDAPAAIEWLCQVFGFERHAVYPAADGTISHAQLTLGGGMIMLGSQRDDAYGRAFKSPREMGGVETRSTYVVVEDVDAVYARAQAAGATIVRPLNNTDYGSREFGVKDPEGHTWSVGTYNPWERE